MSDQVNSHTFKKEERLNSKIIIEGLFKNNQTFRQDPFRVFWMITELKSKYPVQVCISIPKKTFKRAVDRNALKRKIKEAYRKNKWTIYTAFDKKEVQCALMIIYLGKNVESYDKIERKIVLTLDRLLQEYEKNS